MIYLLAEFSIMGGLIKAKYRWKNFSQQDFLNIPPINLPTQKKKKKKKKKKQEGGG